MINIYVTIHTGTHQSITTAHLQRGGARMMAVRGRQRGGGEGTAVGEGSAVILKGCEQVATPPARTLQHRNSGNFIRPRQQQQGCSLNTCKCMKAHTHLVSH